MKCLCKPPDYISVPIEHGMTETYLLKGFGTVLHGKKADRECFKCGIDLCVYCAGTRTIGYDLGAFCESPTLCPSCI